MLVDDEKKLTWWGIDMRSRAVRRIAVALTYVGFLVAVWGHAPRAFEVLCLLFFLGVSAPILDQLEITIPLWGRQVLAGLATGMGIAMFVFPDHPDRMPAILDLYAFMVLILVSVVGWGKLVEMSGRGWLGHAVAKGEPLSAWKQRLARIGFAIGLEGFALYEYGMKFRRLSNDQKSKVREMRMENPRGRWVRERTSVLFNDERMRHEDERLRATVQRVMSTLLMLSALGWYWADTFNWRVAQRTGLALAFTLAALAVTLRQAIVLCTEEDPRGVCEELGVI